MYAYRRATEEQEWISAQHSHPNDSADFQGIYKKKRKKRKMLSAIPITSTPGTDVQKAPPQSAPGRGWLQISNE